MQKIERNLALVKINASKTTRLEIIQIIGIFRARTVDVSENTIVAEITGDEDKINAFLSLVKPFGIKEMVRTGIIAIARGKRDASPV